MGITSIVVLTNLLTKEIVKIFPFTKFEMKDIPHTWGRMSDIGLRHQKLFPRLPFFGNVSRPVCCA